MKKINKTVVFAIVIAVVFAAAGFFGGTLYQKSQTVRPGRNFGGIAGGIGNSESQAANAMRRSGGLQGGFTSGDIVAKDNNSITLKLRDGSTRIIFYSSSTQISKQASGTVDDLAVGSSVMVTGTANSDGSVNAQNISLRPTSSASNAVPGGSVPGGGSGQPSEGVPVSGNPSVGNMPNVAK